MALPKFFWAPTLDEFGATHLALACLSSACFLALYFSWPRDRGPTMDVPLVQPSKSDKTYDFQSLLLKGYFDNPGRPYKLAGPKNDLILLPARYAAELGTHGSSKLSFGAAIHDFWVSKHTTWRYYLDDDTGRQTLMGSLRRDGAHIVPLMDEEIELAFSQWKWPQSRRHDEKKGGEWTEIAINPSLRPLVNRTFGRILVGEPLCRDSAWLNAANGVGLKMMLAARDLRPFPYWARPFLKHFIPTYRALMAARRTLVALPAPILRNRLSGMQGGKAPSGGDHHDLIDYQLNHVADSRATDVEFQTGQIFDNVFAGDNQLVNAILQCIYDLATYPEYIKPMRDEVRRVLGDEERITIDKLARLRKVDSFMKEVLRLRPGTLIVMARKALVDVTMSDGLFIPRGVTVAMPSFALNHDPAIYGSHAAEFKPFRFVELDDDHDTKTTPAHLAFEATLGPGLDFGRGKATCPGRYWSLWTMKVIFARFLLHYDVKLKPGTGRPTNIDVGVHKIANMQGDILIREAREC